MTKNSVHQGRRHPTLAKRLGVFVASASLTLLMIEGIFRLFGIEAEYHTPYYDRIYAPVGQPAERVPYAFVPNSIIRSTYDSNPRGYFDDGNGIEHNFNNAGWRDVDHTVEKPVGTYRILGLGDSYLFGQGVRYEHVCLSRLEKILDRNSSDSQIETINMGLRSLNTAQECEILKHRGLDYKPDAVILHFVLNDVERSSELFLQRPKIEFTEEYVRLYNQPDAFSNYGQLWGWARQRYQKGLTARAHIRDCLLSFEADDGKWLQCRQAITEIHEICVDNKIPLLVVIFPFFHELDGDYPFQSIHNIVRKFCESSNIHVLDLREQYRTFHGPELWVHPTDQHPNEIAHDIAARAMAEYLLAHSDDFTLTPMNASIPTTSD